MPRKPTDQRATDEEPSAGPAAIEERLRALQAEKRRTVRWTMSRDTAERAIEAIAAEPGPRRGRGGKPRSRKRHKRLL